MRPSHQVQWAQQNTRFNLLAKKQPAPNTCRHQWMPITKVVQIGKRKQTIPMLQCQFCAKLTQRRICGTDQIMRQFTINALCRSWNHSYEEERNQVPGTSTGQIFRPTGSRQFPPSRFRMKYVFHKNGDFEYLTGPLPACGWRVDRGTWQLGANNRTILWKGQRGDGGSFQILQVTQNILKITTSKKTTPQKAVWLTNFAQAKIQAAKEGKLLLMEFTGSDWCGPCIALEKNVLSTDTFKQNIPGKFILLKLDNPRDKSKQTPQEIAQCRTLSAQYKVRGVPTIIITDATGSERHRQVGYSSRQSAQQWVSNILKVAGP
jgi:thioredoxin-related protein